jgi:hypothetical protein
MEEARSAGMEAVIPPKKKKRKNMQEYDSYLTGSGIWWKTPFCI